jgi:hypothetical protein
MECEQDDVSQAGQNKRRKRDRNSEDEFCTKKQKRPPPTYQNPLPLATNKFFVPIRDLPIKNVETGCEGNANATPGSNACPGESKPPVVLTSQVSLIILERELKSVVSGEFLFRNIATGTRTTKSMVD